MDVLPKSIQPYSTWGDMMAPKMFLTTVLKRLGGAEAETW